MGKSNNPIKNKKGNSQNNASRKYISKSTKDISQYPSDFRSSYQFLRPEIKRFHGIRASIDWFPQSMVKSKCSNKFGYMTTSKVRASSKLGFNNQNISLLNQLGDLIGNTGREGGIPDSTIPAGYTYFGQFVDHDITLDVSSTIDMKQNAELINNMRTPALDLDSLYSRGPALHPFIYEFPSSGFTTAIKLKLGRNKVFESGGVPLPGGPGGNGGFSGMRVQSDFDLPRMEGTNTAIIGDPRNDENLIVSQFHHSMLKFHNKVVDLLVGEAFLGDIFVEAKRIVTHHYQWAVVNDFLKRICGTTAVNNALTNVSIAIDAPFKMPVEFAVGAYRFGHSMIRDRYWLNFNFTNEPLSSVFAFVRNPNLPVLSNWVVDFNAFFQTGIPVPIFNMARKIDSVLANGLEALPGGSGIMAMLATRNLRRGLSFGLPSGQATAKALGLRVLTENELKSGLPENEIEILNSQQKRLLKKTPLWYYVLRESAILNGGNSLGPLGAKIVADTFIKMLKRDGNSYLNHSGGFTPFLPSETIDDFTVSDLIKFAGVNEPQ